MAQPSTTRLPCNEANIVLAISALKRKQISSVNYAAATYNVPEATLRDRLAGKAARRDYQPNSRKLTNPKEEAIKINCWAINEAKVLRSKEGRRLVISARDSST
jgi:hypothetical protein